MATAAYNGKLFYTYLDSDRTWELIEKKTMGYDVDIDELYPEHFQTDKTALNYQKVLDKMMVEGEEYKLLDDKCDGYAITSFARIINAKHINQTLIYISKHNVRSSIRNIKIDMATEFAKYNWPFNINNIKRIYNENKWEYKPPTRIDI
jgi:hypothetical protein